MGAAPRRPMGWERRSVPLRQRRRDAAAAGCGAQGARAALERQAGAGLLPGGQPWWSSGRSALGQGSAAAHSGAAGEGGWVPCSNGSVWNGAGPANPPKWSLPLMPFLCCCAGAPANVARLPLPSAGKRLIPFGDLPCPSRAGEAAAEVGTVGRAPAQPAAPAAACPVSTAALAAGLLRRGCRPVGSTRFVCAP